MHERNQDKLDRAPRCSPAIDVNLFKLSLSSTQSRDLINNSYLILTAVIELIMMFSLVLGFSTCFGLVSHSLMAHFGDDSLQNRSAAGPKCEAN